jgi:general secretion pathway protein E/type IV pilus assembly protein PilB
VYRPKGCTTCDQTGYKGRLALLEILKMNSDLDDLLARGATTKEIREAAYEQGFFTLADDGVRHIMQGTTSIDEVARVADLTERMS